MIVNGLHSSKACVLSGFGALSSFPNLLAQGRLEPHELAEEHLIVEALSDKYHVVLQDG